MELAIEHSVYNLMNMLYLVYDWKNMIEKLKASQMPDIPVGQEVAGVVTQVGSAVKSHAVGDRIAGTCTSYNP